MFQVPSETRLKSIAEQGAYVENLAMLEFMQRALPSMTDFCRNYKDYKPYCDRVNDEEESVKGRLTAMVALVFLLRGNIELQWWLERNADTRAEIHVDDREMRKLEKNYRLYLRDTNAYTRLDGDSEWRARIEQLDNSDTEYIRIEEDLQRLTEESWNKTRELLIGKVEEYRTNFIMSMLTADKGFAGSIRKHNTSIKAMLAEQLRQFQRKMWIIYADAIGAYEFIWHTQRDERVRAYHQELEGKVMALTDPRLQHLFDYGCRCYIVPTKYYER